MIVTLAGNNRLELSKRLEKLTADFAHKYGELAIERLDGEETTPQTVTEAVSSLPFLAEKKLVVVRNLSANKVAAEQIEQIIDAVSDSTDLVFYELAPDKRTTFYKTLKKRTEFEELNELEAKNLPKWLIELAAEKGGSISSGDAAYLIERVGANQQLLAGELEKLIIYEPQVSRPSIDSLTEKAPQSRIFDLLDAAFGGNKARALQLYDDQRAQGVEPIIIMSMIARQLLMLTAIKTAEGRSTSELAKDLGMNPFPLQKAAGLANRMSDQKLRQLVIEAEKIDRLSKSQTVDLDEAIKTYIATI